MNMNMLCIFSSFSFDQDASRALFKSGSLADKGTMVNFKHLFGKKDLQGDVMHNFFQFSESLHSMAIGDVCLLAMDLLGMTRLDDVPSTSPHRYY